MKKSWIIFVVHFLIINVSAQIYISPDGSDSNTGKIDSPYKTITKGVSTSKAGDTIFVRGGIYELSSKISISTSKSGTSEKRYYLLAYNNERPILDFSDLNFGTRGIELSASYWFIKGLDIMKAGDNGMMIKGSNNVIEYCSFYENMDTGLQLSNGASNNKIINCDSYNNADPDNGDADGFAPKLDVGTGNYFFGCRAWQNSDDGWDGYMRNANDVTTTLENCWCFNNGYLKNGAPSSGNGNGYKMGGGDNGNSANLMHHFILKNCIAFGNRVKGFDQNNNKGSMTLLNCSAHKNGTNYKISLALNSGQSLIIKNSLAVGVYGSLGSFAIQEKNSWLAPFSVTAEDFLSLNPEKAFGPRKPDGSLPDIDYLHLTMNSDLIDAGVDVGLEFIGSAPDLGAFETKTQTRIEDESSNKLSFSLEQNFPNPFNPETTIMYSIPKDEYVTITIYNSVGIEVAQVFNDLQQAGKHELKFNGNKLSSGIYYCRIKAGSFHTSIKMLLLK